MERIVAFIEGIDWQRWSGPAASGLRIVLILALAWVAIALLQRMVRKVRVRIANHIGSTGAARRAETLGRVVRYLIAVVVGAVALMLVLAEVGVSLAPILGAAGVVGLAIGFGAQSLVKDYFTGFFLLMEDQIRTGDVIRVADIGGLVEDMTLRHVRLRDYDGNVHFIPNGMISSVTNMSRDFAQAVIDVGIAYRENVDDAFKVMQQVGAQMRGDAQFGPKILADLEIAGVDRLDDSAVVLRCRFKVAPLEQWSVRREFLRRIKGALDASGIEIPYPHLTLYAGSSKDGTAPALPLRLNGDGAFDEARAGERPLRARASAD